MTEESGGHLFVTFDAKQQASKTVDDEDSGDKGNTTVGLYNNRLDSNISIRPMTRVRFHIR